MKVSKANATQARRIFAACSENGSINGEKLRSAVRKIAEVKPRGYLQILDGIKRLVRLENESREVLVESAEELTEETKIQIKSDLSSRYGDDLNYSYKTDPALLAGLKIRVGNDVWDGSVASRLKRLQEAF